MTDTDRTTAGPELIVGAPVVALTDSGASIHDDANASRLGFRGAAVGGTTHLDCFVPPLLEAFGDAWFERGTLSLYFENVIVSGEQVEAVVIRPATGPGSEPHVSVWARRADDPSFVAARGTASLGAHDTTHLRTRDLRLANPDSLRMLHGVHPGFVIGDDVRTVRSDDQRAKLASGIVNQGSPWYVGESPWGGPIACPSLAVWLLIGLAYGPEINYLPMVSPTLSETAAMYGAAELAFVNGPILLDTPYRVRGHVVGVGESPKTEYLWWDATATDESDREVARVRHLFRIIKADSPLYRG